MINNKHGYKTQIMTSANQQNLRSKRSRHKLELSKLFQLLQKLIAMPFVLVLLVDCQVKRFYHRLRSRLLINEAKKTFPMTKHPSDSLIRLGRCLTRESQRDHGLSSNLNDWKFFNDTLHALFTWSLKLKWRRLSSCNEGMENLQKSTDKW